MKWLRVAYLVHEQRLGGAADLETAERSEVPSGWVKYFVASLDAAPADDHP